jgi:hypothetical protein
VQPCGDDLIGKHKFPSMAIALADYYVAEGAHTLGLQGNHATGSDNGFKGGTDVRFLQEQANKAAK